MKANEVPERIYVPTTGDELHYHMTCPNNEFQESIEYVCADAFIEKAEGWLREVQKGFILTDKDITDFVNFMKV